MAAHFQISATTNPRGWGPCYCFFLSGRFPFSGSDWSSRGFFHCPLLETACQRQRVKGTLGKPSSYHLSSSLTPRVSPGTHDIKSDVRSVEHMYSRSLTTSTTPGIRNLAAQCFAVPATTAAIPTWLTPFSDHSSDCSQHGHHKRNRAVSSPGSTKHTPRTRSLHRDHSAAYQHRPSGFHTLHGHRKGWGDACLWQLDRDRFTVLRCKHHRARCVCKEAGVLQDSSLTPRMPPPTLS